MQLKLSTLIPTLLLIITLPSTLVLANTEGVRAPPSTNLKARHNKLVRAYKNDAFGIGKRESGVPGTYYNILMGVTACGGRFQPHDSVSFYFCLLFCFLFCVCSPPVTLIPFVLFVPFVVLFSPLRGNGLGGWYELRSSELSRVRTSY